MIDSQLRTVLERVKGACAKAGRSAEEIELVLVTKGVEIEQVQEAYRLGCRSFGESRAQDLVKKQELLPADVKWHFIGNLQTNKVKYLGGNIVLIHSCDRLELAEEIQKQAEKRNRRVDILIQVNTSGERTKHGFHSKEVEGAVSKIAVLDRLNIRGLMTIGPHTQDAAEIQNSFKSLRILRDELRTDFSSMDWHYLSMGMSADFEIAIEEGANLLRIGTAVFGERAK